MATALFYSALAWLLFAIFFHYTVWKRNGYLDEQREWEKKRAESPKNIVFIGYSRHQTEFAESLRLQLENNSFTVRMWNPSIPFDDPIKTLANFLVESSVVLTLPSSELSNWIRGEIAYGKSVGCNHLEVREEQTAEELIPKILELSKSAIVFKDDPRAMHERLHLLLGGADSTSKSKSTISVDHESSEAIGAVLCVYAPAGWLLILALLAKAAALVFGNTP